MSVGSLATIVGAGGPLPFVDVLTLGADAAASLADRHAAGEAHGGVQPRVVVRDADGAWVLANPLAIGANEAATAPELADDPTPTPAADLYALGATLVFALTGQAFQHGSLGGGDAPADGAPSDGSSSPDGSGPDGSTSDGSGSDGSTSGGSSDGPSGASADPDATAAMPAVGAPEPTPGITPVGVVLTVPEVMELFLTTLRRMLASDPTQRGNASDVASTLRRLRGDAERALAGTAAAPPPRSRVAAAAVAGGVAGAAPAMALAGDPAADPTAVAAATPPRTFKQRLPGIVAVAAVLLCFVLGVALLRKSDKPSDVTSTGTTMTPTSLSTTTAVLVTAPPGTETTTTTLVASTTTTKPVTTTTAAPVITAAPTTTIPPGTALVTVDMSRMTNCQGCLASLRSKPQLASQITAQFPDKTELFGQCVTNGDSAHDDFGTTFTQWIFIIGPIAQGWIPLHLVGRQTYNLPPCPQETTTTVTTTPPTTPPTTAPPETTTTTIATTTTTIATTTTKKP